MVTSEKHQKALLGGVERFIGLRGQENAKFYEMTSKVLAELYSDDILTEEVITAWGSKASKKVRKNAETFLTWLAEAESEEDDSE